METRLFRPSDLTAVSQWWVGWGEAALTFAELPEFGLLVPGVAAMWLYRSEAGVALLESLITNPEADRQSRAAAIGALVAALVAEAGRQGFRCVVGFTANPRVVVHAENAGMQAAGKGFTMVRKVI